MGTTNRKSGSFASALCSILGTLILLLVIAAFCPMTIPRLMGYEVYNVVSGSMEPEIPIGSLILVQGAAPEDISEGEIIAFQSGDSVITHRVVDNRVVEGEFVTRGDANDVEDMAPIPYESVIGRVRRHIPALGGIMELLSGKVGKLYAGLLIACGFMFHMLAARLRYRKRNGIE